MRWNPVSQGYDLDRFMVRLRDLGRVRGDDEPETRPRYGARACVRCHGTESAWRGALVTPALLSPARPGLGTPELKDPVVGGAMRGERRDA